MNNNITETSQYLEDLGLIYIPETDKAGIHLRGLAKLIGCDPSTPQRLLLSCSANAFLEAEIQTQGGMQAVAFVLEDGVIEILEKIMRSPRVAAKTRDGAINAYRNFAKAGFKLYAMLQVAPEKLGVEPKPSPRKSLNDLSTVKLWALYVYKEAETESFKPDLKVFKGIDPAFWSVPLEVARYAYSRRVLEELEWVQPTQDLHFEVFGNRETLVKDMRREFDRLQDQRCYVAAFEAWGIAKELEKFEAAINGSLVA